MIDDILFVPDVLTPLSEAEATFYLKEAFKIVVGHYPTIDVLALVWAHSALEVGRWRYIHNNNWGNIKKIKGQKYTSYRCSEILNGKEIWFDPPHVQTLFAAWDTPLEGAIAYLTFLKNRKRYQKAWAQLIIGNAAEYSHELKVAGYYTANEARYTAIVVKLTLEFKGKAKKLLDWKPETIVLAQPEKSAIDLANVPIIIPEPDFKSAPKEEPSVELTPIKNWFLMLIEFILAVLTGKSKSL